MNKYVNQIINAELPENAMNNALLLCARIAQKRLTPPSRLDVGEKEVTFVFSGISLRVGDYFVIEVPAYSLTKALEVLAALRGDK